VHTLVYNKNLIGTDFIENLKQHRENFLYSGRNIF